MGNAQTSIDLDFLFSEQAFSVAPDAVKPGGMSILGADPKEAYHITVNLKPSPRKVGLRFDTNAKCRFLKDAIFGSEPEATKVHEINWTPATHMRDFEVLHSGTPKELKIARHQGIGVVIVMPTRSYLKFHYGDPGREDCGIEISCYADFKNDQNTREVVSADLSIGYEVLIIEHNDAYRKLCEPRNERDERETMILFSHLAHLANFEPGAGANGTGANGAETGATMSGATFEASTDSESSHDEDEGEQNDEDDEDVGEGNKGKDKKDDRAIVEEDSPSKKRRADV